MPPTDQPATPGKPFPISRALRLVRKAIQGKPRAALFELRDEGYSSVFELLAACIISIRTLDETTLPTARKLFAKARTPAQVASLSVEEVDALIGACTFHEPKAKTISD